jgi:uncharacterized protein
VGVKQDCLSIYEREPGPQSSRMNLGSPMQTRDGLSIRRGEPLRTTRVPKKELAMEHIPHELPDEFSTEKHLIERLTKTNYEFGRLAAAYDEVNRHIWRIESEDEATSDEVLEKLKKRRLLLKDEIAAVLTKLERRM